MANQEKDTLLTPETKDSPILGVPALVVSGFLGAGKTTLVKHLIADAQRQGLRLAVVSNEFGELGIDRALLQEEGGPGYVELEGGCVCCQLSSELLQTLQGLWETVRPDRVIVETSGVALPFETLMTFWREPVNQWAGESIAVVVVNAEQVAEGRDLEGTFEQQVSSSDLLVINKIDLVQDSFLKRIESQLQEMAPGAPMVRSIQGQVESSLVFPPNPADVGIQRGSEKPPMAPHTHEHFSSKEIKISKGISTEELRTLVEQYQALRVKGIVDTSEGLRLVQGVGPRLDLLPAPLNLPNDLVGRIVVIHRQE